jgi:hypothetical protein
MPKGAASSRPAPPANSEQHSFYRTAVALSRNPLGIFSLFITLIYGMAVVVFAVGASRLDSSSTVPMIWCLSGFPFLLLASFVFLVTKHHEKLYAPGDFENQQVFFDIIGMKLAPQTTEYDREVFNRLSGAVGNFRFNILLSNMTQKQVEGALSLFNAKLKQDPLDSDAVVSAGRIYRHLAEVKKNQPEQNLHKAIDILTRFISNKAIAKERDKDLSAAIYNRACYRVLLRSHITNQDKMLRQNTLQEGLQDLKMAIEIDSDWANKAHEDDDFASLHTNPDFQSIVGKAGQRAGFAGSLATG